MIRRPISLLAFALLAGALGGWLAGQSGSVGAVADDYYVWVHPGGTLNPGSATDDYLTCGYHSTCLSVTSGTALDWRNTDGENVYYRSDSSNSAGYSWAGTALITETVTSVQGGSCYTTYVWQYRRSGTNDSAVKYQHTGTNYENTQFTIWSGSPFPQWTSRVAGQTMNEPSACVTDGDHLHQQTHVGGNHWKNTHYDEMSDCDELCGDQNVMANYQLGYYWSE